jgi:hypothetical protein
MMCPGGATSGLVQSRHHLIQVGVSVYSWIFSTDTMLFSTSAVTLTTHWRAPVMMMCPGGATSGLVQSRHHLIQINL